MVTPIDADIVLYALHQVETLVVVAILDHKLLAMEDGCPICKMFVCWRVSFYSPVKPTNNDQKTP